MVQVFILRSKGLSYAILGSFNVYLICILSVIIVNLFEGDIQIFPNPSTGLFTIQTTKGEQLSSLEVYNAFGKLIYQTDNLKSTEVTIDLSGNSSGIYFLKLSNNNKIHSRKILLY